MWFTPEVSAITCFFLSLENHTLEYFLNINILHWIRSIFSCVRKLSLYYFTFSYTKGILIFPLLPTFSSLFWRGLLYSCLILPYTTFIFQLSSQLSSFLPPSFLLFNFLLFNFLLFNTSHWNTDKLSHLCQLSNLFSHSRDLSKLFFKKEQYMDSDKMVSLSTNFVSQYSQPLVVKKKS